MEEDVGAQKVLNMKVDELLLFAQLIDSNGVGCAALKILLHCNKFKCMKHNIVW